MGDVFYLNAPKPGIGTPMIAKISINNQISDKTAPVCSKITFKINSFISHKGWLSSRVFTCSRESKNEHYEHL